MAGVEHEKNRASHIEPTSTVRCAVWCGVQRRLVDGMMIRSYFSIVITDTSRNLGIGHE